MFQLKHEPPYAALLAAWTKPGGPDRDAVESTREAFGAVRPDDLAQVRPLVEALLARLGDPASGDRARAALLALLDGARRRFFTSLLAPEGAEPWTALVDRIVVGADYTLAEVLRSREETDPKTVAFRVLGDDPCELTVADVARRTRAIARGLLALDVGDPAFKVAILSE